MSESETELAPRIKRVATRDIVRSLDRLSSGLLVPARTVTAATPYVMSVDEAAQPPKPEPQIDGIQRSKQQSILDAPVQLDPAVRNVIMKTAYSFHFNRRTGVVQIYHENHEARRKQKLEKRRQEKRESKQARKEERKSQ